MQYGCGPDGKLRNYVAGEAEGRPRRYQALKAEMAAVGHTIGRLRDLDEAFANDPVRRYEVMKARIELVSPGSNERRRQSRRSRLGLHRLAEQMKD